MIANRIRIKSHPWIHGQKKPVIDANGEVHHISSLLLLFSVVTYSYYRLYTYAMYPCNHVDLSYQSLHHITSTYRTITTPSHVLFLVALLHTQPNCTFLSPYQCQYQMTEGIPHPCGTHLLISEDLKLLEKKLEARVPTGYIIINGRTTTTQRFCDAIQG